ncbi:MAG: ABC transporter permease [Limnochordia bacterium]|jgi:peptide/nickel transport system permease protein
MKNVNWDLRIGAGLLLLLLAVSFVLPIFAPFDPVRWNVVPRNMPPGRGYLLGTTSLGQDVFWLLTVSIRNSLVIGFTVALFASVIGLVMGLVAGFKGGAVDRILTLLMDAFIVVPALPILILFSSLTQGRASLLGISAILVVFNWPRPARQVRASVLSLRERAFIHTASFSGARFFEIIWQEIFPHVFSWSLANFVYTILTAISTETGLAVIGLSGLENTTLGGMIYWAIQHQAILAERWWWIGAPTAVIVVLFVALVLSSSGITKYYARKRGR